MPQRRSHVAPSAAQSELATALATLRTELDAPTGFPPEALAEAAAASPATPDLDLRDIAFATLDPAGSMDLDQAFQLERSGSGYTVRYAIADVPSFVAPGGALDAAARLRGETLYAADGTIPLHPPILSEDHASLLPDQDRPALVWTFALDAEGSVSDTRLERALIRSRAKLDYVSVQADLDAGRDSPGALLPEIGRLRLAQEAQRGGASLNLPDDEVVRHDDGTYAIERRTPLPVEDWNAQLSLMTGMAAAQLMLQARIGILRTMPQPEDAAFETFRHQTEALGVPWTTGRYGDYLRTLDKEDPRTLPILEAASALFRGAGYVAFDGTVPAETTQAAIAAPYAHATAPLRRLVDRWSLTVALAVSRGEEVPAWVRQSLPLLPDLMRASAQRASALSSRTIDLVEAALLAPRVGETFDAVVIRRNGERGTVQIEEPPVTASVALPPEAAAGAAVRVTLTAAGVTKGQISFAVA
ncbi:RNB domain-containing ribonuclease [uncultured Microbacterium sp.]|uniref:RNB domain-containing ribonuclease n=1 Tax=uncultured Microbacterium sp. TaxID=191216 RepID=UPI0025F5AB78|nr:RNB domain-containing ribonuclease [uncultured Microbacterium sp.]